MRRDFLDDEDWKELADRFYIGLPVWATEPTDKQIRKWLRRFKIPVQEYLNITGYKKISDFREYNPDWPLRAFVGLLLEYVAEREDAKNVLKAYDRN